MFTVRRSNEEQPTSLKRVPNGTDDSRALDSSASHQDLNEAAGVVKSPRMDLSAQLRRNYFVRPDARSAGIRYRDAQAADPKN